MNDTTLALGEDGPLDSWSCFRKYRIAYMYPGVAQNSELLEAMRRTNPYYELLLYNCVVVEPCMAGGKPSRPYGDAPVCPAYNMLPVAFAERFCNTEQKFNVLQPNVKEIKRLAYVAHREKWGEFDKHNDLRHLPWPLITVPTSVEDITVASLHVWVLVVLNDKYDWWSGLDNERQNFGYILESSILAASRRKKEKYSTMLEKMCRVLDNVLKELERSPDVWAALGCPPINRAYKPLID